ncbi:hypothetical protein A5717_26205 [Mycolicibacterium porcinum]|uniref:hypothetical protein n=1 Tax=Mycolicibacterium porcinum TaxID=39693 RepID=UPI00080B6497|nr:hypothetical protein [Mycolicibacterium porcinum]OCB09270.1 hypothetical protein A5717_26205 [Mycolicibacterium porcinum]
MTASTAPHGEDLDDDEAINIDSVVCTCCDTRWWPAIVPRFPENYLCDICEQWFALFQIHGEAPVFGPARTLRRALAGQEVTYEDYVTDQSTWVIVQPAAHIRELVNKILEARPNANH